MRTLVEEEEQSEVDVVGAVAGKEKGGTATGLMIGSAAKGRHPKVIKKVKSRM